MATGIHSLLTIPKVPHTSAHGWQFFKSHLSANLAAHSCGNPAHSCGAVIRYQFGSAGRTIRSRSPEFRDYLPNCFEKLYPDL